MNTLKDKDGKILEPQKNGINYMWLLTIVLRIVLSSFNILNYMRLWYFFLYVS